VTVETPTLVQDGAWGLFGGLGYIDGLRPTLFIAGPGTAIAGVWRYTGLTRSQRLTGPVDQAGVLTPESGRPNTLRYRSAVFAAAIASWDPNNLPCTLAMFARRTTPEPVWSTANAPALRDQSAALAAPQLENELDRGTSVLLARQAFAAVPASLTFNLDLAALHAVAHTPDWDGNLNVWIIAESMPAGASGITLRDTETDASPAVLTLDVDTQDLTGLQADRPSWQGRARRCPRCGRPKLSDDFVRDGETRTFVCHDCYDIRQVPRRVGRGERPPINEG
jgi:hypothetical protein